MRAEGFSVMWRKSSFSSNGSACVEVAPVSVGVAVRDSKNTKGSTLAFGTRQWRVFVSAVS